MATFATIVVLCAAIIAISASRHHGISCHVGTDLSNKVFSGFSECVGIYNLQTGSAILSGHRGHASYPSVTYPFGTTRRSLECKIELNSGDEMVARCRCKEANCNKALSNSDIVKSFKDL